MNPDNSIPAITGNLEYCYREESEGACYNPDVSLRDEHLESSIAYDEKGIPVAASFHKHVAHCNYCMGRLLGCARNRRCTAADNALRGATLVIAAEETARRRGLRQWSEEARDSAAEHCSAQLASIAVAPDKVSAYTRKIIQNALTNWWRNNLKPRPRGNLNDAKQTPVEDAELHADVAQDPLSELTAEDQYRRLLEMLRGFKKELRTLLPLHGELCHIWMDALLAEPEKRPSQERLAQDLGSQKDIWRDQVTVGRWLKVIQLRLFPLLDDEENGLTEAVRNAAIQFFCYLPPRNSRRKRTDIQSPNATVDTNPETGDTHE